MRGTLTAVLALLLLATLAGAAQAGLDVTQWQFARRISAGPEGWTEVEVDGPLWAGARPDLADLRILTAGKQEVPWQAVRPPSPTLERFPVQVFDVLSDAALGQTSFVADLGRSGAVTNRLVLRTSSHNFFKQLTFAVSNDLQTWQPLGGGDAVYDLAAKGGGASLEAAYPYTAHRYLRVVVADLGTPPLAGLGAELQHRRLPPTQQRPLPAQVLAQGQEHNDAWTLLDLGYRGIPVDQLTVSTSAARFYRPVLVEGSNDRTAWTPVVRSTIYRQGPEREQLGVALSGATYRFYRITVLGGDDTPLTAESVTVLGAPHRLLFRRTDSQQLFVLYGNPAAQPPRYDPEPFQAADPGRQPATLGRQLSVMSDPEALQAAPPNSDADPKLWRFERPLPPGLTGFVQLTLDAPALDGARSDLADLRLVDDAGLEVPYLLRTDRTQPPVRWPYQVASRLAGDGQTGWVLDLGARNLPSQWLRLAATGANLSHSVRIDGSDDGQSWRPVGSGQVRRVETIFGSEENLVVTYPEARWRYLRVSVDGAGGDLEPAEVKGFVPAVLLRAEPDRKYRLFYGNPRAGARTYAPALFADAYALTRLGPEALTPALDHAPPPERPAFLKPGATPRLHNPASPWVTYSLWTLLAALVVGLGAVVFRVFRSLLVRSKE